MNRKPAGTMVGLLIIGVVFLNVIYGFARTGLNGVSNLFFVVIGIAILYSVIKRIKNVQSYKRYKSHDETKDIFAQKEEQMKKEQMRRQADKYAENYKRENKSSSQKHDYSHRCQHCNTLVSSKDTHCPECGAPQSNTVVCRNCGHVNPKGNVLCEKCNDFLY